MCFLKKTVSCASLLLAASLLGAGTGYAADHRDSPAATSNPAADLNDIYAFMNPNNADELILIMTVFPDATADSQFAADVTYNFFLENNAAEPQSFQISCTFSAEQAFTCSGPADIAVVGESGSSADNGGMRVFAGLRDDPFFFDGPALRQTLDTGVPAFTDPGTSTFGSANVLAIVIGLERGLVTDNLTAPVLRFWGNTERRSGS